MLFSAVRRFHIVLQNITRSNMQPALLSPSACHEIHVTALRLATLLNSDPTPKSGHLISTSRNVTPLERRPFTDRYCSTGPPAYSDTALVRATLWLQWKFFGLQNNLLILKINRWSDTRLQVTLFCRLSTVTVIGRACTARHIWAWRYI